MAARAPAVSHDLRLAGVRHIRAADPRMREVIDGVGPCLLARRRGRFEALVRAIIGQQVSGRAADTIRQRVYKVLGGFPSPEAVMRTSDATLRGAGLSRQKQSYVRDLAHKVHAKEVRLARIGRMEDEAVIAHLTQVKGIGRWTAEMFLMFVLNRPDVLPVDDLGIQKGFHHVYGLRKMPSPKRMAQLAAPWRPYRTVGCWYLWRALDGPAN